MPERTGLFITKNKKRQTIGTGLFTTGEAPYRRSFLPGMLIQPNQNIIATAADRAKWLSPKNKKFLSNLKKGSGFEKIE